MSLKFDIEKKKNIAMMVETTGIDDTSKLDFTFNIVVEGVRYGFLCELKEGRVEICIPALSNVIKDLKTGTYKASLDVTGDKNYFLQPFNENVELTVEKRVGVVVSDTKQEDIKEAIAASISKIVDEDGEVNLTDTKKGINTSEGRASRAVNKMFE